MIFGPNPPPTNGATTRTCDSSRPSILARPFRIGIGACVVSQIVISSARGSQSAATARFSIAAATPRSYRNRRLIDDIRGGTRLRVIALALHHVRGRVGLQMRMHQRRARRQRRFEIVHRVDRIDVDDDVGERVFRDVAALGHDHRDGLADVADFVLRQRQLRAAVEHVARHRRRIHQHRTRLAVIAEIAGGVNGHHAGALPRRSHVDAVQRAVRDVAAHEGHVQHSRQLHVVDEHRATGEEPRVFVAPDAWPKEGGCMDQEGGTSVPRCAGSDDPASIVVDSPGADAICTA